MGDAKHQIALDDFLMCDRDIDIRLLESRRLFKTMSLCLAERAGIVTPPLLLVVSDSTATIGRFAQQWGDILMLRIDYSSLPRSKPLGGIPIRSIPTMCKLHKVLRVMGCYSLWHTPLNRLSDLYSVGVSLTTSNFNAEIEVVGPGFDAGDLRLGLATPHETLTIDMLTNSCMRTQQISSEAYTLARQQRMLTRRRIRGYTSCANEHGRLITSLSQVSAESLPDPEGADVIPSSYRPMRPEVLNELLPLIWRLRTGVITDLPFSNTYVGSLSFVPPTGWVLWDVFGSWYARS